MRYPPDWQYTPYQQPQPWELQTEHRLTRMEGRLESHDNEHNRQQTLNKVFAVALISVSGAVAHSKVDSMVDTLMWLVGVLSQ